MAQSRLVYVAGPYTASVEAQRRARLDRIKAVAAKYARRGDVVIPWWVGIDPTVHEAPDVRGRGIEENCIVIRRMVAAASCGLAADAVFVVVGARSAGVQVELEEYIDACREYGHEPILIFEEV